MGPRVDEGRDLKSCTRNDSGQYSDLNEVDILYYFD